MIGPMDLAKAPRERKIPRTVPFWSSGPNLEASVVMQETTIAVARKKK